MTLNYLMILNFGDFTLNLFKCSIILYFKRDPNTSDGIMKILEQTTTTNQAINTKPPSDEGNITTTNIMYNNIEYTVVQDNKQSNDERSAVDL